MNSKKNSYAEVLEFVNEAKETFALEKSITENSLSEFGIDPNKVREYITTNEETTLEDIVGKINDTSYFEELKSLFEMEDSVEITKENMITALKNTKDLIESEKELADLENEANQSIKEYMDYMNSMDYEEKVKARRDRFVEELEKLEIADNKDYIAINKLKKEIKNIDDRYTLAFMFENPFSQIDNMTEIFFNNHRSNYMIKKYNEKCTQLGIDPNCFKFFFNLEEKFLEERYWVFNNLFLFTCLREISNTSVYSDGDRIKMIIRSLHRLFYNKFACEEFRDILLNSIRAYLDRYIDAGYTEKYLEKNITHPTHPHRKEKDAERENRARERIYTQLMKNGYIESAADVEGLSIKELYEFLDKKNIEKLEAAEKRYKANEVESAKTIQESTEAEDTLGIVDEVTKVEESTEETVNKP